MSNARLFKIVHNNLTVHRRLFDFPYNKYLSSPQAALVTIRQASVAAAPPVTGAFCDM